MRFGGLVQQQLLGEQAWNLGLIVLWFGFVYLLILVQLGPLLFVLFAFNFTQSQILLGCLLPALLLLARGQLPLVVHYIKSLLVLRCILAFLGLDFNLLNILYNLLSLGDALLLAARYELVKGLAAVLAPELLSDDLILVRYD